MTDRDDRTGRHERQPPRDADELTDAVAELGETDDDRLDAVTDRNDSLEERLPGDDELPLTKG